MPSPDTLTVAIFILTIALVLFLVLRPGLTASRPGKILAFVVLFLLPIFCTLVGTSEQIEHSKQTKFCLSCHVMEPYGKSLMVEDAHYIAAAHFQNHRIPADEACYTCHTDYTMYGGLHSKIRGLHHVYVQYLGNPKPPLHLYTP